MQAADIKEGRRVCLDTKERFLKRNKGRITMVRHNCRARREFKNYNTAIEAIKNELKDFTRRTSRSFWVGGVKYIARKTNLYGVNLTVTTEKK